MMDFVQKRITALGDEESVPQLAEVFIQSFKNLNNYSRKINKYNISK